MYNNAHKIAETRVLKDQLKPLKMLKPVVSNKVVQEQNDAKILMPDEVKKEKKIYIFGIENYKKLMGLDIEPQFLA